MKCAFLGGKWGFGMDVPGLVKPDEIYRFTVESEWAGSRLDKFLSAQFPCYSRNFFQQLINKKRVSINDEICRKTGVTLRQEDGITVIFPPKRTAAQLIEEHADLGVTLVHEHDQFLILGKPAGLLVHSPHHLSEDITLVDWVLTHYSDIKSVGYVDRPGIVHRLDKNTSGLIIVPRTNYAHGLLSSMFRDRKIQKVYLAIVEGHPPESGSIDFSTGRDPVQKIRIRAFKSPAQFPEIRKRETLTFYRVLTYFKNHSLVEVRPVTGRTHQIRVHMAAIGHPLVGDHVYGKESKLITRHALHAHQIGFSLEGERFLFSQETPSDFSSIVTTLEGNDCPKQKTKAE